VSRIVLESGEGVANVCGMKRKIT